VTADTGWREEGEGLARRRGLETRSPGLLDASALGEVTSVGMARRRAGAVGAEPMMARCATWRFEHDAVAAPARLVRFGAVLPSGCRQLAGSTEDGEDGLDVAEGNVHGAAGLAAQRGSRVGGGERSGGGGQGSRGRGCFAPFMLEAG
jgi:hypothetical protein